jgi:hypothetical protein
MEIFYKDHGRLAFRSNSFIENIDKHRWNAEQKETLITCSICLIIWLIAITIC